MIDKYVVNDEFNISNGIPSTYLNSITPYEQVTQLITYVNSLWEQYTTETIATIELTSRYNETLAELTKIQTQFSEYTKGKTIPDGSVTLAKLSQECFNKFIEYIIESVHNCAKFVWFELDDSGHLIALIPYSWNELTFGTSTEGRLTLEY